MRARRTTRPGPLPAAAALLLLMAPASATAAEGILTRAIALKELRIDHRNEEVRLAFGDVAQDVDINSVIRVLIDKDEIARAIPSGEGGGERDAEVADIIAASESFEKVLEVLVAEIEETTRIDELIAAGQRGSAEFAELAAKRQNAFHAFSSAITGYAAILARSSVPRIRDHAGEFGRRFSSAIHEAGLAAKERQSAILTGFVREEVAWVNEAFEGAARKARTGLRSVALVLVARTMSDRASPQRIHLEHYDPLPPGAILPYAKVNWMPDPEQSAQLKELYEAARKNADLLEGIRLKKVDLGDAIMKLAAIQGLDPRPLIESLEELSGSIGAFRETDWDAVLRGFLDETAGRLRDEALDPNQRALLEDLKTRAESIVQTLRDLRTRLEGSIRDLEIPSIGKLAREAGEKENSIDALLALLGGFHRQAGAVRDWPKDLDALRGEIAGLGDAFTELRRKVAALADSLQAAAGPAKERLESALEEFAEARFMSLSENLRKVRDRAIELHDRLANLSEEETGSLELYANADLPVPEDVFYVLGANLKNTYCDLRVISGRQEGDVVRLEARLYRLMQPRLDGDSGVDRALVGEELESEAQEFRMSRFGWFNAPNAGVAYVSSLRTPDGQAERSKRFSAQVSWLFRHRSWIDARPGGEPLLSRNRWYKQWGIGLHTIALDMNNDNEQEIGAGLTVSLFGDLLQLGYGLNLTVDSEPYAFVGFKMFQFGKGMGIDERNSPLAAAELAAP